MSAAGVSACARWNRSARVAVRLGIGCLGLCMLMSVAPLILAQSGGGYDLHGNTQNAGGGMLSGASGYTLDGTIAQPDANSFGAMTSANNYALLGGFWPGVDEGDVIFRDGFEVSP